MSESKDLSCKHEYIVGYSFRMPHIFFKSVPCDLCGNQIRLSLFWKLLFMIFDTIGFGLAFYFASKIQVEILGSTFIVSVLACILFVWVVQLGGRFILRIGKWKLV